MEEIVELDIYNILAITSNEYNVIDLTDNLTSIINDIYPNIYNKFTFLNLVGIYRIYFTKSQIKDKIEIVNTNINKTGLFGTLGNKGYITFTTNYNNNCLISFTVWHIAAGKNPYQEKLYNLKQILETKIYIY